MPSVLTHAESPHYQHHSPECYIFFFLIKDESTLAHCNNPKSIVHLRLYTLGVVHSMGFDKCIMTYYIHYNILRSILTALKILYTQPIHPSPTSTNSWKLLIFVLTHSVAFYIMSYNWNNALFSF